jgi:hypothetical protein
MSPKVQLYEKDHITHDALLHAKRLDDAIQDSHFTEDDMKYIYQGMQDMYVAKAASYR